MEFGKLVKDSLGYAKEGLVGKWINWILLIVSCIIFPFVLGYIMRIYRGASKAPDSMSGGACLLKGLNFSLSC